MKETPKARSLRIRRSLIQLPLSLFANLNGKNSRLSRLAGGGKGLMLGVGAAAGVAFLASSYMTKKDEEKPGEETPDFEDKDLEDLGKEDKEVEKSTATPIPATVPKGPEEPPKTIPASKPIEKPAISPEDRTLMDKVKGLFSSDKAPAPKAPGLSSGLEFTSKLSKTLDQKYRSKFEFSGFKAATSLSKYGAFTAEEASTIVALKTQGVNTSANAGAMSKDIEDRIRYFSKKHGFDADVALKMAQMESGGNPNAISATGAIGINQFTGRTASEMGITNRFDPDQNIEAGILLAKKSVKKLTEADLPLTATNIYLMHQLGVSGARELIKAAARDEKISSLSENTRKAVKHNFGASTALTAKDYIRQTEIALDNRSTSDRFASSSETAPPVRPSTKSATAAVPVKVPGEVASVMPQQSNAKPVPIVIAKDQTDIAPQSTRNPPPQDTASVSPSSSGPIPRPQPPQALIRSKSGALLAVS